MEIKLLVLRTSDPKRLADFYNLLGLTFDYHKHGNSPYHYSASVGPTTLEIYPLTKTQTEPDQNLRIGFSIDNFLHTVEKLKEAKIQFSSEPMDSDFGFMAVVSDPDGRKIELYRK